MLRRIRFLALTTAAILVLSISIASPAQAATLKAPSALSVSSTTSSISVKWAKAKGAKYYKVCFRKSGGAKCWKTSGAIKKTSYKRTGLKPTSGGDYYITVSAYRGKSKKTSKKVQADLKTGTFKSPTVSSKSFESMTVKWVKPTNADSFKVELADNTEMRNAWSTKTTATAITLTPLAPGREYFVRITPFNSDIGGASASTSTTTNPAPAPAEAKVMTYNLCGNDQCNPSDKKFLPEWVLPEWKVRVPLLQTWLATLSPDIMGFQEDYTKLQVSGYKVAGSEKARSLLFKSSKFTKVRGGSITLPGDVTNKLKYATWAEFKSTGTGLRFIVVTPHFYHEKGVKFDNVRKLQAQTLVNEIAKIRKVSFLGNSGIHYLPVIIAGDVNSNSDNANQNKYPGGFDAPKQVFTENGYTNSLEDPSTSIVNKKYNTFNGSSQGKPVMEDRDNEHHVDVIWVSQGIQALNWIQHVRLKDGDYETPFYSDHNPVQANLKISYPMN